MLSADEIISDLERQLYIRVVKTYPERVAIKSCRALFDCLFYNFRAQPMYVPTRDHDAQRRRDDAIYRESTGHNHAELAIKYSISLQQIYSIIKSVRSEHVRRSQSDLFPLPDAVDNKPQTLTVFAEYVPAELIRCGLGQDDAENIADELCRYLCKNYPGISIRINNNMRKRRLADDNADLFCGAI